MNFGEFLGRVDNVEELISIISSYPHAYIYHASSDCSCGDIEIYYNEETNTITFS